MRTRNDLHRQGRCAARGSPSATRTGILAQRSQAVTLDSVYDSHGLGPALKRLRKSRGIPQKELAQRISRSAASVSRIERAGSNPKAQSLLRYLAAIDASLADLHAEMGGESAPQESRVELGEPGRAALTLLRLAAPMRLRSFSPRPT